MKKIKYLMVIALAVFLLYFPFFSGGGDYYRGVLGIWHKYKFVHTPGFLSLIPDHTFYEPLPLADPTSFHYVDGVYAADRFYVYVGGNRIPNSDGKTFRSLGNNCYADQYNARCAGSLALKKISKDSPPESFDIPSFEGNILYRYKWEGDSLVKVENYPTPPEILKDKTGFYTRWSTVGGSVEIINGMEWNFPIYDRIEDIDADTFDARLIWNCHWQEKEQKCEYQYDCVLTDKHFIYETKGESCQMTGQKFPKDTAEHTQ